MDRSFLSDDQLIRASRHFVCIRLATYEDSEEARFLKNIFVGRTGELENTVFCLLDPSGRQKLCRPARGPNMQFGTPQRLAREMQNIATRYPTKDISGSPRLPKMKSFRLGLNVAECDALPLVTCIARSSDTLPLLESTLAPLAFHDDLAGRFIYAATDDPIDLAEIRGDVTEEGFVVIAPGQFGVDGDVKQFFPADTPTSELLSGLKQFADQFHQRNKNHRNHVREGNRAGVEWQTEVPVTDPMSNRAKEQRGNKRKRRR